MALEQAETLVTELAFTRSDVTRLLEASAATNEADETVYRPYAVAYYLWLTSKNTQRLKEAERAVFELPRQAMRDLLKSQQAFDTDDLDIPEAWTVQALRAMMGASSLVARF